MLTQNKKSKFLMYHAFSKIHFGRYCMNINQFKNQKINNDYIVTFDDGPKSLYRYRDIISTKGQSQLLFHITMSTCYIKKTIELILFHLHSNKMEILVASGLSKGGTRYI